jgi:hypothetical protein
MDLGLALETLGERESGTEYLQQAVDAYNLALQENTRQRVPLDWAMTQADLGIALTALGRRTHNPGTLQQARICFQNARPIFQNANMADSVKEVDQAINDLQHELVAGQDDKDKTPGQTE